MSNIIIRFLLECQCDSGHGPATSRREKISGRNGMVGGVGRAVTTVIGIRKSLAVALAQRSPTSLAKNHFP